MVYAVQAAVGFRNTSRRDQVMGNVQTRLSAEAKWGETVTRPIVMMTGEPGMAVEVRFTTAAARDQFWTDVVAFMGTGVNGPVAGSSIWRHDCPHDGASPAACVVGQQVDY